MKKVQRMERVQNQNCEIMAENLDKYLEFNKTGGYLPKGNLDRIAKTLKRSALTIKTWFARQRKQERFRQNVEDLMDEVALPETTFVNNDVRNKLVRDAEQTRTMDAVNGLVTEQMMETDEHPSPLLSPRTDQILESVVNMANGHLEMLADVATEQQQQHQSLFALLFFKIFPKH